MASTSRSCRGMFMALRMEDRFPLVRHPGADAADPRDGAVGALPAQPRRADARDGHRRGARLHVPRLRRTTRRCASTSASAAGSRRCWATTAGASSCSTACCSSLPGTPVLYYGDEIGMGDNVYLGDRNGVRTPMQWSGDRNAGFTEANRAAAVPAGHHRPRVPLRGGQRRGPAGQPAVAAVVDEAADRAAQAAPRRSAAARSSSCTPTTGASSPSCASTRASAILVVANLSRFVQYAELDLSAYRGLVPVEMFGRVEFPRDRRPPLFLTLGPHGFYLVLARAPDPTGAAEVRRSTQRGTRLSSAPATSTRLLTGRAKAQLSNGAARLHARAPLVPLEGAAHQARSRCATRPLPIDGLGASGDLRRRVHRGRAGDLRPAARARPRRARSNASRRRRRRRSSRTSSRRACRRTSRRWPLYDALVRPALRARAARRARRPAALHGRRGRGHRVADERLSQACAGRARRGSSRRVGRAEQSNTSVAFGDRLMLKLFRRLEPRHQPGHRGRRAR